VRFFFPWDKDALWRSIHHKWLNFYSLSPFLSLPFAFSRSLSLSLTHTHTHKPTRPPTHTPTPTPTHTHTPKSQIFQDRTYCHTLTWKTRRWKSMLICRTGASLANVRFFSIFSTNFKNQCWSVALVCRLRTSVFFKKKSLYCIYYVPSVLLVELTGVFFPPWNRRLWPCQWSSWQVVA
jgi:hypothetical protein